MIPGSHKSWQTPSWQDALKQLVTEPELRPLLANTPAGSGMEAAARLFPLRIPRDYLARIPSQDPEHPVLKQFVPDSRELVQHEGFGTDPLQESRANPLPGLIHKYSGRVLLIVSSSCPVHCRYCFRRHFPYGDNRNSKAEWTRALDYIRADPSIREVIYSGGDPLSAGDDALAWLTQSLAAIPHLQRLRVHSRYPLVLPQRIGPECLHWLAGGRLLPTLVIHCNHPEELDESVLSALQRLRSAGVTLLNQSVLLKGVNDELGALVELSEKLHRFGVLPYYLHLLDRIQGAAHFEVAEAEALSLYRQLATRLPGYLLPRLVREEPGELAKSPRC